MNGLKKSVCITKRGSSFAKFLEATAKLPSDMKTLEDPIEPILQVLLSLSTYTTKDYFCHIGVKISEFSDQNKWTVAEEIVRKWGQSILGSGACIL